MGKKKILFKGHFLKNIHKKSSGFNVSDRRAGNTDCDAVEFNKIYLNASDDDGDNIDFDVEDNAKDDSEIEDETAYLISKFSNTQGRNGSGASFPLHSEIESCANKSLQKALNDKIDELTELDRKVVGNNIREIPWIEDLSIDCDNSFDEFDLKSKQSINCETANFAEDLKQKNAGSLDPIGDLTRENLFRELTMVGAKRALKKITQLGMDFSRPYDYLAEMLKDDEHMRKVKESLFTEAERINRAEVSKRRKIEKKFNKKSKGKLLKLQQEREQKNKNIIKITEWKRIRDEEKQNKNSSETAEESFNRLFSKNSYNKTRNLRKSNNFKKNKFQKGFKKNKFVKRNARKR